VRERGIGAALGVGAIAGGAVLMQARRRKDDEPYYVVVHGNGGSAEDFGLLLDRLGVGSDRVASFDYRDVGGGATSREASRAASTERAAEALDRLIRDLSVEHGNIYSIHHSKGGAVGVSMIGALDDGSRPPIDGYVGAALLDPAIGNGWLGYLQRLGGLSTLLPDNGGFDVQRCTDGECRDVRENLGEASGVEVIAIRNLDAEVTNFRDRPEGLRVYDLVHDGGAPARYLFPVSPLLGFKRVWSAHGSVLEHDAVADCIRAEVAEQGSCVWNDGKRIATRRSGGGGSRVTFK
jgi:pimeloyl-ACP methyl ester carboxylesterase